MEDIKFKSITDLYKRLLPALVTRKNDLRNQDIDTSELEIWNYLRDVKWIDYNNLTLYDMVDHIFNFDLNTFEEYRKQKIGDTND